jgi:hypothetical protein
MRVFYYDEDNGIFQGEGYEDGHITPDTPGMTTIAPPPREQGMVPVFLRGEWRWIQQQIGRYGTNVAPGTWRCRIIKSAGEREMTP